MISLVVALSYSGFVALYLAKPKHYREFFKAQPSSNRTLLLRCLGWLALGAALIPAVLADGWQIGPVLWIAVLSSTVTLLVFFLPYQQRLLLRLPLVLLPTTLLAALVTSQ